MSQHTRCQCGHTPGRRFYFTRVPDPCLCDCHFLVDVLNPPHPAYGPTPVQRQPSKATGQLCPLVLRKTHHDAARYAPVKNRARMGWFTTGWGR